LTDADHGFETVAKFPRFKGLPIIISEADPEGCAACSSKVNPANNYRNGLLYPAYTAVSFKGLFELQDRRSVNLLGMLSWSFEFEDREYFEGFRDLATNGVDKPVLNVFRMFGLMRGDRVETKSTGQVPLETLVNTGVRAMPDVDALATRDAHEAAVLVWNYHDVDGAAAAVPVALSVANIPAGVRRVLVEHYRLDDVHSNSYAVWKAMGSPQHPTAAQYADLQASGQLQMLNSPVFMDVLDGKVQLKMELPRQGISLIHLRW
jgi:xylan 1,4-beta-xylosidase